MRKIAVLVLLSVASLSFAQTKPTVYLEPQQGFETYVAAAIQKKGVPVDVVTDKSRATYVLRSAAVEIKSESTGGKIARCMFAYCIGIEDKGNVSVQLIDTNSSKMLWAYSVNKQKGGSKNQQSMAEAIAKHFKEFLASAPAIAQAPPVVPTPEPAPAPAITPAITPVAYEQPAQPVLQTTTLVNSQDQSLGDAARKAKQHQACLDLARTNPSIACN
jgi:hypothetical protein